MAWSTSGMSLAVGTATKGLLIYGVYDTTADATTSSGHFGFDGAIFIGLPFI